VSATGHVVLLGDSIFDNAAYTEGGPDVVTQLRGLLPRGWSATLSAVDGAVVSGVAGQVARLPADTTQLVLSAGGNDALGHISLLERDARTVGEGLSVLARAVERFAQEYRESVALLQRRGLPLTLCTIYEGNFPDRCSLEGIDAPSARITDLIGSAAWVPLLPEVKLAADDRRFFSTGIVAHPAISHVRLNIFPDGGISRLRLWGTRAPEPHAVLNALSIDDARAALLRCCGATRWAGWLLTQRPFASTDALFKAAAGVWTQMEKADMLEAFSHHPEIGSDIASLLRSSDGFGGRWPAAITSTPESPHCCITSSAVAAPTMTEVRPTSDSRSSRRLTPGRRRSASIRHTETPACASPSAVTKPVGPPPTTITSCIRSHLPRAGCDPFRRDASSPRT